MREPGAASHLPLSCASGLLRPSSILSERSAISDCVYTTAKVSIVQSLRTYDVRTHAGIDAQCPHDGWTALHWTVWRQNIRGVQFLIDNGASPRLADMMHRRTPLHWAAVRGNATIVKALLNAGGARGDVDVLDGFGLTTFQIALDCNQSRAVLGTLLESGARLLTERVPQRSWNVSAWEYVDAMADDYGVYRARRRATLAGLVVRITGLPFDAAGHAATFWSPPY